MSRSVLQAQAASPTFTHVYAALVAVINTKVSYLPLWGLLLRAVISTFYVRSCVQWRLVGISRTGLTLLHFCACPKPGSVNEPLLCCLSSGKAANTILWDQELLRLEGASVGCVGCIISQPTRSADET